MNDTRMFVLGTTPGFHAFVDTTRPAPPIEHTASDTAVLNQQLAQSREIEAQTRQHQAQALRMG